MFKVFTTSHLHHYHLVRLRNHYRLPLRLKFKTNIWLGLTTIYLSGSDVIALTTQVIEIKDLCKELLNLKLWQGDLHSVRLVKFRTCR
jgi:hypothetical protein